jgi:hypothetical protein
VGLLHLLDVGDEDELGEVKVDRGAGEMGPGGTGMARGEGLAAQGLVLGRVARPRTAPISPPVETGRYAFEVRRGNPVGGKPRLPV